jgi:hypothetical protein
MQIERVAAARLERKTLSREELASPAATSTM